MKIKSEILDYTYNLGCGHYLNQNRKYISPSDKDRVS